MLKPTEKRAKNLVKEITSQALRNEKDAQIKAPTPRARLWRLQRNALHTLFRDAEGQIDRGEMQRIADDLRSQASDLEEMAESIQNMLQDCEAASRASDEIIGNTYVADGYNHDTEDVNFDFNPDESEEEVRKLLGAFGVKNVKHVDKAGT